MKSKINFLKTALITAVALFSFGSIQAQCDYTDDFASTSEDYYPGGLTTPKGWSVSSGERYLDYLTLYSVLKSPIFTDGFNSLSFKYSKDGWYNAGYPSFKIEIKKEIEGVWTTVWTDEITNPNAIDDVFIDVSYDNLQIEGTVQLVITRLTPNGYDYSVPPAGDVADFKDFCLTNYTPEGNMGVENISASAKISVYPNPFSDYLVVNTTAKGKAAIYNMSGQMVLSVNVQSGSNRIKTSTLPKGVYILRVGDKSVKIVK